ncbi:MAG: diacylglycerol kinase family protein [Patescibacteria group bacterium]|nr:diacylglycerol kinase family protein [Patescibacteria group bacterium]
MQHYDTISIIYNPVSTGPSKSNAETLAAVLRKTNFKTTITTIPTDHSGHAEVLAHDLALASKKPLIISSSGDGGYNEVINGAMEAQAAGAKVTVGLLPSGNANDHYSHVHTDGSDLADRIGSGDSLLIDVLKVTYTPAENASAEQSGTTTRFAHSYVGLGLTPHAGKELNKRSLNFFNEKLVVIRSFFSLKPITLKVDNRRRRYDSLVFSNVQKMAKVLTLSDSASVRDGLFEVTAVVSRHKLHLLRSLAKTALATAPDSTSCKSFAFTTTRTTPMQLDGEIVYINGRSKVTVEIVPRKLRCII